MRKYVGLELILEMYDVVIFFDNSKQKYSFYKRKFAFLDPLPMEGFVNYLFNDYIKSLINQDDLERIEEFYNNAESKTIECQFYTINKYEWFRLSKILDVANNSSLVVANNIQKEKTDKDKMLEILKSEMSISENANKTKNTFLAKMSHDMRTPMNGIIGMVEIANRNIDNKNELQNCLKKIGLSSQLLLSLINDILDYTKIEQGKEQLHLETVDLKELIAEVVNISQTQIEKRNIKVDIEYRTLDNEFVHTDPIKLRKIIMNIFSNAVKYTKDEISIVVSEDMSVYHDHRHYSIRVTDNGIGMSEEFLKKLYIPFSRESKTRISNIEGTGLGLAITKSLITLMNGSIIVSSKENLGSTFTVSFDFTVDKSIAKASTENVEIKDANLTGKKFLIVEDNLLNAEILSGYIDWTHATYDFAHNGLEAVKMALNGSYDLIFMDIEMPLMNGFEATIEIRKSDTTTPIIAMTADAFAENMVYAKKIGMNEYITKPIDYQLLNATYHKFFDLGDE